MASYSGRPMELAAVDGRRVSEFPGTFIIIFENHQHGEDRAAQIGKHDHSLSIPVPARSRRA
jgi:hypothetical protein